MSDTGPRETTTIRRAAAALLTTATLFGVACAERDEQVVDTSRAAPAPSATWTVSARGIGPLRAGMTLAEAAAAGATVVLPPGSELECDYADWRGGPVGVGVMVERGRVVRVEVDSGEVATAEGARVGDGEARVRALYPGRIESTPHKYTDGRYLGVRPSTPADSAYGLVFETDAAGRVTRYRGGLRPAVDYVEGCS